MVNKGKNRQNKKDKKDKLGAILLITMFAVSVIVIAIFAFSHVYAASHTHSDACYNGTRHTHSSYGGSCYSYGSTGSGTCGSCSGSGSVACSQPGTRSSSQAMSAQCNKCYTNWSLGCSYTTISCSGCGKSLSTTIPSYSSSCPSCGHGISGQSYTTTWDHGSQTVTCGSCSGSGYYTSYGYYLSCGRSDGTYYNSSGSVCSAMCDSVVTSLVPISSNQTIVLGGTPNVTATATFLSGRTATVTCNYSGFNGSQVGTAQTVTLSYGSYSNTASNATAKTTTIQVTVNGYYNLTVNSAHSVQGTVSGGGSKLVGSTVTVSAKASAGATFAGWYNGDTWLSNSVNYSFTMPAYDYTVTARWTGKQYTLNIDTNGGSISSASSYTLTYGSGNYSDISWLSPSRTGYTFAGWYTAASGGTMIYNASGIIVNDGTYWKDTYYVYAGNLKVYAHWTVNKYSVTFDANGGSTPTSKKSVTYDSSYGELPTPTRTGYTFAGWYNGSTQVTSSTTVKTASNHTLTAKWTANSYTVTFDPSGGSTPTANKSVKYDSTYGTLPTPTRTGYTLAGWYNGSTQVASSTSVKTASNHTLTAKWTANNYTVNFNANGGSTPTTSKTVTFHSAYGTLPTPTRVGYIFDGWFLDSSEKIADSVVSTASNHTLVARWTARNDIPYVVNHYIERDGMYRIYETIEYIGTADATVQLKAVQGVYKEYEYASGKRSGTAITSSAFTVMPDGSMVIDLYYDRRNPLLTLVRMKSEEFTVTTAIQVRETVKSGKIFSIDMSQDENIYAIKDGKLCKFIFKGWYTEAGTQYTTFNNVTEDVTLYARYDIEPYLFDAGDGSLGGGSGERTGAINLLESKKKTATALTLNRLTGGDGGTGDGGDGDSGASGVETLRFMEHGATDLKLSINTENRFDYVKITYPWLETQKVINYEDGVKNGWKWNYSDQIYTTGSQINYDDKKYRVTVEYYAELSNTDMLIGTYEVEIWFVPFDTWRKEIGVGRM